MLQSTHVGIERLELNIYILLTNLQPTNNAIQHTITNKLHRNIHEISIGN